MATISAATLTSTFAPAALVHRSLVSFSPSTVMGLPAVAKKGKVRCSMERSPPVKENKGLNALMIAAVCASAAISSPAMALVDERMSTEGTGLPFGLSNNLLGWILLGVFGLIWSLYIVYASTLEEDEESGLSL